MTGKTHPGIAADEAITGAINPITPGIYVIRTGDYGFHLIGPFENPHEAAQWASGPVLPRREDGFKGKNNPNDDPRWCVIDLSNAGHFDNAMGATRVATPGSSVLARLWAAQDGYGR